MADTAIQNFAFQDHLVRVVEYLDEPWFVGKDVCNALGILKHRDALSTLDPDERASSTTDPLGAGGAQEMTIVSEPGVYRLVFRSRKAEAERFKHWLAHEVLPQIRRTGQYSPEKRAGREELRIDIERDAPLAARVDAVRLAARLFGKARARQLWGEIGLPTVPPASEWEGEGEAVQVIRRILDHELEGRQVRLHIMDAIDGDEAARVRLGRFGIRSSDEPIGFYLSNTAPEIVRLFANTPYRDGEWRIVLLRLNGAMKHTKVRFSSSGHQARATWFPARVLDDYAGTKH